MCCAARGVTPALCLPAFHNFPAIPPLFSSYFSPASVCLHAFFCEQALLEQEGSMCGLGQPCELGFLPTTPPTLSAAWPGFHGISSPSHFACLSLWHWVLSFPLYRRKDTQHCHSQVVGVLWFTVHALPFFWDLNNSIHICLGARMTVAAAAFPWEEFWMEVGCLTAGSSAAADRALVDRQQAVLELPPPRLLLPSQWDTHSMNLNTYLPRFLHFAFAHVPSPANFAKHAGQACHCLPAMHYPTADRPLERNPCALHFSLSLLCMPGTDSLHPLTPPSAVTFWETPRPILKLSRQIKRCLVLWRNIFPSSIPRDGTFSGGPPGTHTPLAWHGMARLGRHGTSLPCSLPACPIPTWLLCLLSPPAILLQL